MFIVVDLTSISWNQITQQLSEIYESFQQGQHNRSLLVTSLD